ncbi:AraC family transcriptional regulator [Maribacter cobaltidurans]|uniref:Uncharacterized protein n=1 Tax=Maribacter cobaltidurans TaxID=1178778 RepID=A0A223V5K1_9FLAO|nr:AraC family transcriptional regulator [Maribacter cobaltidurans]ASV30695.1 hypothetical protein CJ263_10970 [Maribacter cobaltidurans]GGD81006.1 AraC family transcriptional regulator [Maribacter cobaltidurans]
MKVLPFIIPKSPSENLVFQIDEEIRFYDKLHQHEEIQISYISRGHGKLVLMDSIHPYHPNDLFVLGSNMPHLFKSEGTDKSTSKMYTLFFTNESFGKDFFDLLELQYLKSFFTKVQNGFKILENQKELGLILQKMEDKNRLDRFLGLLHLLKRFCEVPIKSLSLGAPSKIRSLDEGERLQRIFDLVIQNFKRPISLEEVAELTYMTKNSFCRFFKKHTNQSFFDFLISYRVEHACQQLAQSKNDAIMNIAEGCGFQSQSNFNRRFKEIKGVTPTEYRKSIR